MLSMGSSEDAISGVSPYSQFEVRICLFLSVQSRMHDQVAQC
jgi:hypothetical protein